MSASTSPATLFQPGSSNRVLAACVLFSVMLHAALLCLVPGIREQAPAAAGVLTAMLLRPEIAPEPAPPRAGPRVPEKPRPARTRPQTETPPPVVSGPDEQSGPSRPEPLPDPAPAAPFAVAATQAVTVVPAVPAIAARPQSQPAAAPRLAKATASSAYAPDAGNLDQYRLALIGAAKRYKHYPVEAMENGWTGKVEVRLSIGADGVTGIAQVKSSSGHDILDTQALDMIRRAKSLTPVPPALRGREFSVDIPVIFDLETG